MCVCVQCVFLIIHTSYIVYSKDWIQWGQVTRSCIFEVVSLFILMFLCHWQTHLLTTCTHALTISRASYISALVALVLNDMMYQNSHFGSYFPSSEPVPILVGRLADLWDVLKWAIIWLIDMYIPVGWTSVFISCLEIHCNLTPTNPSLSCPLLAPLSLALCKSVTTASRLYIASHQPRKGNRCTQTHRQCFLTNFVQYNPV